MVSSQKVGIAETYIVSGIVTFMSVSNMIRLDVSVLGPRHCDKSYRFHLGVSLVNLSNMIRPYRAKGSRTRTRCKYRASLLPVLTVAVLTVAVLTVAVLTVTVRTVRVGSLSTWGLYNVHVSP